MSDLNQLAELHGTDKRDNSHGYCQLYDRYFKGYRAKPCTLLEMGVAQGSSLRMWRDWMPLATVVGFDRDVYQHSANDGPRIRTFNGSQQSTEDLDRMLLEFPKFDIVVDDAGHEPEFQLIAFNHLWPRVKPGGWYVVEDITPGHDPEQGTVWFQATSPEAVNDLLGGGKAVELHLHSDGVNSFNERGNGILFLRKRRE